MIHRLSSRLLDWLAQAVEVSPEDEQIVRAAFAEQQTGDRAVFLVFQEPSYLDLALIKRLLARMGVDFQGPMFSKSTISDLAEAKVGVFFIRSWPGSEAVWANVVSYRDRLWQALDDLLRFSEQETVFIPATFLAGLGPSPLIRPYRLFVDFPFLPLRDVLRLASYLAYRKNLRCNFGPPASTLRQQSGAQLAHRLVRTLAAHRRLARGAEPASCRVLERSVLSGQGFEQALDAQSKHSGVAMSALAHGAAKELRKMAAKMQGWAVRLLSLVLRPLMRCAFRSVEAANSEQLVAALRRGPTVIVSAHRSHFDYLVLSYLLYFWRLPLPFIAAGENLNFWPIGAILRAGGAFFIRRQIGDDHVYKAVLAGYLSLLLKQGSLIEFFIEGGRSRAGSLRSPRLGLLKYLIAGWEQGDRQDVIFVPANIGYERVPEEASLIREYTGVRKRKENFLSLLRSWRIWGRRVGAVRVVFGKPISLQSFSKDLAEKISRLPDSRILATNLGVEIAEELKDAAPLSVSSLGALALLTFREQGVEEAALVARMEGLFRLYCSLRCRKSETPFSLHAEGLSPPQFEQLQLVGFLRERIDASGIHGAMLQTVTWLRTAGMLQKPAAAAGSLVEIDDRAALLLIFYKNNIFHHFLAPAVLAQVNYCRPALFSRCVGILYDALAPFFVLPPPFRWQEQFSEFVHWAEMKQLIVGGAAAGGAADSQSSRNDVTLTEEGEQLIAPLRTLLLPFLETMFIAATELLAGGTAHAVEGELREGMKKRAAEMWPDNRVACIEVGASQMLDCALRFLQERGLIQLTRADAAADAPDGETAEEQLIWLRSAGDLETLRRNLGEQLWR